MMGEKVFEFDDLKEAIGEFKVFRSKLLDMYEDNPIFWYDINLATNESGKFILFVNMGRTTDFKMDLDGSDLEMP